jgi:chemotaxis protein histidine kinase CheA
MLSVKEAVMRCAAEYKFDGAEALSKLLSVSDGKSESDGKSVSKPKCPMPYSGEYNEECCKALRQNKGLYTQCEMSPKSGEYCKQCSASAEKNSGIPEYGTIDQRRATDIYSYVDPKGRKPISFTKVMNKLKLSEEEVKAEAEKFGINIDAGHFVVPETKRGRPAQEKAAKEPKGAKGRPKKAKKVLEIGGEEDDLFASLVAAAFNPPLDPPLEKVEPNVETVEQTVAPEVVTEVAEVVEKVATEVAPEKKVSKKAESEAKKLEKEAKKLEKEAQKAAKEAEKLEKEAKKKAELEAKEAKKKAELEAKEAQKAELEAKKAEKEAKKAEKESKKAEKKPVVAAAAAAKPSEEEEQEVVKKIEVDGKKYLKSKSTGIIYDYNEYVTSGEQVVVGKWNETTNKIDFQESGEESEDEYDE